MSIRFSEPSVAGTHNGAHHEGWYGDIVSWEATADASRWTPVEIGTIDELNAKIEQEKATYNSAKSNAAEILASANYSLVSTTEIALQVKDPNAAGYVWANTYAPGDEGVIDYLIDGDNNTFFHTTWQNGSYATDGTKDYLEVDLGEGESATNIVFDFVTRHNGSTDFPASVTILGSNDKSEYEEVGTISFGLPVGNTKSYTSPAFGNGKSYRYIRFRVNSTSRGNASVPYFHLAEFNLYKAEVQITEGYEKYVSEVAVVDAANKLESTTPNEVTYAGTALQNSVTAYNDVNREVVLVYNLYYGERLVETQKVVGLRGDAFPKAVLNSNWTYVKATTPEGVVETAGSHDITLTVEGCPFVFADSYENIKNWYYLSIGDGAYLLYHVNDADHIALNKTKADADNKDAFTWGYVGNPFDGYKLVNKAKGNGFVLSSSTTIEGDGPNTHPIMVKEPVADGYNTYWIPLASTYRGENAFYLAQKGYVANKMNNRNDKLAYWTGGQDAGSTFMVTERDMTGATDLQEFIDVVDAVSSNYQGAIGTAVGNLTEESVTAVANALATAKNTLALDGKTPEQISGAHVALQAAIDGLVTVQPTDGKFYTIASASEQNEDSRTGKMIYVNADGGMKFDVADNTNLGYLFKFEAAGEGQFYMYNVAKDRYLNTANEHGYGQEKSLAEETTGAKKVTIANLGRENVVGLWAEGGAMIHAEAATGKVVAWDNEENNNGSAWRIVEVEDPTTASFDLTIGEAGYATLYLGCAVTIPEGVEAYAVSEIKEGYVNMTAVTGAIPANEAVILKKAEGQPTDATAYKFNYAASATAVESNLLEGTTIDTYIAGPAYVLGYINVAEEGEEVRKEVGLYMAALNADATGAATGEQTHFKNNANKAYLVVPGASEVASYSFRFGEGTTGISEVKGESGNVKGIYDLTGRRVENISAPGIYIVGGKKVLVK
ncbi:MAG: discoidin domain-containing protein [Bacteroidaceae bacterium]|nr:discoidin domain-containing protein [Bacteroidaceae bacterium]